MDWIKINEKDNVAVALNDLVKKEKIPQGHKFALKKISKGETIIKYGCPIGRAEKDIQEGQWVHTHNVKTLLGDTEDYQYRKALKTQELRGSKASFFSGYVREDGRCAVRNEVWIIATVGCVNSVAQELAEKAKEYARGKVDGVYAITHPYGCSQMGEDQENTRRALTALAGHPNAGGVLLLGLGCENCNLDVLKDYLPGQPASLERIKFLQCQDTEDELEDGALLVRDLIDYAKNFRRQPVPVSRLVVGLKCGGSDGLSGITANPLVGRFSDRLCGQGGSVILTEVPEMFGAERLLMNRCRDEETFAKTVGLINQFKDYFRRHGQVIYENPSPGNKAGGITTLEDKSLGCVQKGGSSLVNDVLQYGEPVKVPGLNLLSSPGNDLVASTALALSGAHLILFTTGRGTPFGSLVPTVKIASNHFIYEKKNNWFDFDGGFMADEGDREKIVEDFYRCVIETASGDRTKCEIRGYRDIAIFKQGVTL